MGEKQIVDDVEFWFPPGNKPIVEYRSASRLGNFDFDVNRKRIKVSFLSFKHVVGPDVFLSKYQIPNTN